MAHRIGHQEIVKSVLDAKAVDFDAVGKVVAKIGPTISLADEPWEVFCGTMQLFVRVFRLDPPIGFPPRLGSALDLSQLRDVAAELK
jgi:hypothetical protein